MTAISNFLVFRPDFQSSAAKMARQFILLAALVLGVVGTTFADETEKIIGGTDAFLGEFPYQVSLRQGSFHFCGGALISDQEVLTAAHCVVGRTAPFDFVVVTGTISTKAGGQTHRIKEIFIHEGYINDLAESLRNDIAIIRLASPYLPHIYQSAIPLPSYQMPDKAPLMVSGWGMINNKGEVPDILQKATVFALSNDMCRNLVPEVTKIFETNLCALNRRGIGVCPGDSGGPLTYEGQVVGIVSMGYPCGLGIPDIYTRVVEYLDFINGILKKD